MKKKIGIFDTSNFVDFPIGGQLTSIQNFLKGIEHPVSDVEFIFFGIERQNSKKKAVKQIKISDTNYDFFPLVTGFNNDYSNVKKSVRLEYLKGIIKNFNKIRKLKLDVAYIHTPEAAMVLNFLNPKMKKVIFSHGNFFGMTKNFRFFSKNSFLKKMFEKQLESVVKKADLIFVLDQETLSQYKKYNKNVKIVDNSIELPQVPLSKQNMHKMLFVGRLSKIKQIDIIIESLKYLPDNFTLSVVGDGEEKIYLHEYVEKTGLTDKVEFLGAKSQEELKLIYDEHNILVMNSKHEGIPMTIIEAQSHGLPVVTTDVGGIKRVVKENTAEFTNGTARNIAKKVIEIDKNYIFYFENSIKNSKRFDSKKISGKIMESLLEI